MAIVIDEEKNGYMMKDHMRYSEGLDMPGVSDLRSRGNKDQSGLTNHLHYREICQHA